MTVSSAGASEDIPLGALTGSAPARAPEIPAEPPEIGARALSSAARLLAGATTFFFLAFAFAYFYLRSLNQEGWWKPTAALLKEQKELHVSLSPGQGLGAAFIACLLISAAATFVAGRGIRTKSPGWLAPAIAGLVLGLVAVALQCVEYADQHFGPTDGAYASVFCAWTGFYLIAVLCTMYWIETQVAPELRARRTPAEHGDIADPDTLISPGLEAAAFYWAFLASLGLIMSVILYLL
jgi:heme/copper-type cytochrome/quinol oxidase subunit 3